MRRLTTLAFAIVIVAVVGIGTMLGLGALYGPADVPDAEVLWSAPMGSGGGTVRTGLADPPAPAVAGDLAIAAESGGVVAIDVSTGQPEWRAEVPPIGQDPDFAYDRRAIVADGDRIYLATEDGLVVLDARDGQEIWRRDIEDGDRIIEVVAEGDVAVAHILRGEMPPLVTAFDATSGAELWASEKTPPPQFGRGLATDSSQLYVGVVETPNDDAQDQTVTDLYALDLATGTEIWHHRHDGHLRPLVSGTGLAASFGDGTVRGLDPATGEQLWTYTPPTDKRLTTLLAAVPGTFIAVTFTGTDGLQSEVFLIEAATGHERWHADVAGSIVGAVTAGETLAFEISPPTLLAFDARTGEDLWHLIADGPDQRGPTTQPRTAGHADAVLATGLDGTVQALSTTDGQPLWTASPGETIIEDVTPLITDETIYLTGPDGFVRAFDVTGGEQLWQQRLGTVGFSQHALAGGHVYATTGLGSVRAYHATEGTEIWRTPNKLDSVAQAVRPVAADDVVIAGAGSELWALDATSGDQTWSHAHDAPITGLAVASEDTVLAAWQDGTVATLTTDDGRTIWSAATPTNIVARPVVTHTVAIVTAEGGHLTALSLDDGRTSWTRDLDVALSPSPATSQDVVYIADGQSLTAIDATTGYDIWRHEPEDELRGPITITDNRVHVTSADRNILIVDAHDGNQITLLEMNRPILAATGTDHGVVAVITDEPRLYAIR